MSVLETIRPEPVGAPAEPRPPRRTPRARLSGAHWAMIAAALVALVANLAVLAPSGEVVRVWVAARDLVPGALVTSADLRLESVGVDALLPGLLREADLEDGEQVLAAPIRAGEPLRRSDLALATTRGVRHMSLPIDPQHAVGGTVVAGDRIDLVRVENGTAAWFLTGLRVVEVSDAGSGLGATLHHHLVLEVSAAEALCLAEAIATGGIDVVRSTSDDALTGTCGTRP